VRHDIYAKWSGRELSGKQGKRVVCEEDGPSQPREVIETRREAARHVEEEVVMIGVMPCKLSSKLHVNGQRVTVSAEPSVSENRLK
jgi:hypothetical protein